MPKVSVMIPVFNADHYLGEAIGSVLAQSYQDFEIIFVDDGSTDGSAGIIGALGAQARYKYVVQAHAGESAARNRALEVADGDYVAFLDADDIWLPNSLQTHVQFLDSRPEYGAVFSDGYICDENGQPFERLSDVRPAVCSGDILEALVLYSVIGPPCAATIRRQIITQNQLRFDERMTIGPDWDFWIQAARFASFGYVDRLTCKYRIHNLGVTFQTPEGPRRDSLLRNRYKVLNAAYFSELSLATRVAFLHQLLVGYLKDSPAEQQQVMNAPQFREIPRRARARLLRHVAAEHLLRGPDSLAACDFLRRSVELEACGMKQRTLLGLASVGALPLAKAALLTYRKARSLFASSPDKTWLGRRFARHMADMTAGQHPSGLE